MARIPERLKTEPTGPRLAVNIYDLDHLDVCICRRILAGKVDRSKHIWIDKNKDDEHALLFVCDLLTAALACDLLRSECRKENAQPIRIYLKRAGTWARVPGNAIFTIQEPWGASLHPKTFSIPPKPAPADPLQTQRRVF